MDLFDEGGRYTLKAIELDRTIRKALDPIFKEWKENGYPSRVISHVAVLAVTMLESQLIIAEAVKNRKKAKEEKNGNLLE